MTFGKSLIAYKKKEKGRLTTVGTVRQHFFKGRGFSVEQNLMLRVECGQDGVTETSPGMGSRNVSHSTHSILGTQLHESIVSNGVHVVVEHV